MDLTLGGIYDCGDVGYQRRVTGFQYDDAGAVTHVWWNLAAEHFARRAYCCLLTRFQRLVAARQAA